MPRLHAKQAGVPARDHQGHAGKKGLLDLSRRRASGDFGFKKHGVDVTLEMVDADQRLPQRLRYRLAVHQPHQERPDQPRSLRHRDRAHFVQRDSGPAARLLDHGHDLAQVFARCEFRHHAAILFVGQDLRGDDV